LFEAQGRLQLIGDFQEGHKRKYKVKSSESERAGARTTERIAERRASVVAEVLRGGNRALGRMTGLRRATAGAAARELTRIASEGIYRGGGYMK
jgi:hypothetical protein